LIEFFGLKADEFQITETPVGGKFKKIVVEKSFNG